MHILVLCPHFAPDSAPTGVVMSAIVEGLAERGHRLHVVTALPWYEHHAVDAQWRGRLVRHEKTSWGQISRVHPFPTDKRNLRARALGFAGFTGLASLRALLTRPRPDVVLAMSPPLPIGLAGLAVARIRRAPFVFNIQDVFPDVAIELGLLTDRRVIKAASWAERFSYAHSDAVTVLSDDLRDNVETKLAQRHKRHRTRVEVIPNFVDTERITPMTHDNAYRKEHDLEDKIVVMYAGNVGLSQSLELIIAAARAMRGRDDVAFVINGGGSALAGLRKDAAELQNVVFVPYQPPERLGEVLAAADIHVVPLKRGLAKASVPSKLYSVLAAGRPVLASVDPDTEVDRTIRRAGAGLCVPPDDAARFIAALRALIDAPDDRDAMGAAGRCFVEGWVSPQAVASQYDALLTAIALVRRRPQW
ncbi:MAG TPA: glycosyltransferase family 4 protein [Acidimicrobiales bacterium]|nr:glycosyltransferase family 4 protein [Acidimicrobiales bacterium]